jgi:hypothetical protein
MRRASVVWAIAALLIAAFPAAATAAPAQRFSEHAAVVDCGLSNDDGFVFAFAVASSEFGSFGDLAFWAAPSTPGEAEPTLVSIGADVSATDTSLSATYDLIDVATSGPAGTAVMDATLTPNGPPEAISDRFREGNRWVKVEGFAQFVDVSGTLAVPGADAFDLASCYGAVYDLTYFTTNPAAFVERFDNINLSCVWEGDDTFVGLFASGDRFGGFSDLFVADATGEYSGFGDAVLTSTAFSATYELFPNEGGSTVGSGSASAVLSPTGEITRSMDGSGPNRAKFTSERILVDGTLELETPAGSQTLPMDDEHCYASKDHVFFHSVRPSGPKPGPLANDAPDGAVALLLGRTVRVVTGGNAQAPEEPCAFVDPETSESFELPIEYTAWWTFVGTGGPVTVDTAGSDFDTIVGVYTGSPGSLTQVGCVDDVSDPEFSFQGRITVDTVAGTTYYVQAGGFGGSTGRLQVVAR